MGLKTSDFDYNLPEELIAQHPLAQRDTSRLLVYDRKTSAVEHKFFHDVLDYLNAGDVLVLNDTRVIPARILGNKTDTGGKIEFLLLTRVEDDVWEALSKPAKRASPGTVFEFGGGRLKAKVLAELPEGMRRIQLIYDGVFEEALDAIGSMPLPPYIHERLSDPERYQTVYSRERGSAAAPTAGLHFTPELLRAIEAKGVKIARVLLHVGLGTFRPVAAEDIGDHKMHSEYYEVTQQAADTINAARTAGGRVIAVGTTSARTLETASMEDGTVQPGTGWTDIFIFPGYRFKAVDGLITNFHLPRSTLLMMISALAGSREEILRVYEIAVREKYRFFSFGDAMLIL
jgi:S-adenosylmethionine:tRNA ribosyltransferase-isomerase